MYLETSALCTDSVNAYKGAESTWFWGNRVNEFQHNYVRERHRLLVRQSSDYNGSYKRILKLFKWRPSITVLISEIHRDTLLDPLRSPAPLWKMDALARGLSLRTLITRHRVKELRNEIQLISRRFENLKVLTCPMESHLIKNYRWQYHALIKKLQREESDLILLNPQD